MTLLEMLHVAAEERAGTFPLDVDLDDDVDGDIDEGGEGDADAVRPSLARTFASGKQPQAKIVLGRDGSVMKV